VAFLKNKSLEKFKEEYENSIHPAYQKKNVEEPREPEEPVGFIIYIPHNCVLPNRYDPSLTKGSIFQCTETKVKDASGNTGICYDRWELTEKGWVRIFRSGIDG